MVMRFAFERELCSKMRKRLSAGFLLVVLLFVEGVQLCFCTNLSTVGCIEGERQALLKLKQSFQDNSNRLSSWIGEDCCQWKGVSCSKNSGHVVKLDLSTRCVSIIDEWGDPSYNCSSQLSAPEVDPCLLELKHLAYLNLSGNYFQHSPIPKFLGSLLHLRYLDLSRARFDGMIPYQLGNLTSLQSLDLSDQGYYISSSVGLYTHNFQWASGLSSLQLLDLSSVDLTKALGVMQVLNKLPSLLHINLPGCGIQNTHFSLGSLNTTFLASVYYLSLSDNMLTGPIPNALQNLSALRELDLSYNVFNSSVPLWLGNSKNLIHLNVGHGMFNNIEGGLLSMLDKVCSLKTLDLSSNIFYGEKVLGSNKNSSRCLTYDLEYLDLSDNAIIDSRIPNWFGQLKGLKYLFASRSSFYGPIPSLKQLLSLRELNFSNNQLNGTIPQWLGRLSALESLSLQKNSLSGTIPQSMGKLSMLRGLYLSENQLSGTIPQSLGGLSTLRELDLSENKLSGTIPQSMGGLSILRELDISENQLSGTIPESLGRLSTLEQLHLSYNQLVGSIPDSLGKLVNLEILDISCNSLEGIVSEHHFANLSMLNTLVISSNRLTFQMKPDWIPPFSLLELDMSSCPIGSQFPQWLRTQKNLGALDLSNANISGGLPIWLGQMSLGYLDLSSNQISETLPTNALNSMPRMSTLLLSNNQISGILQNSLCRLEGLEVLDISRNKISGEIPQCWRKLKFLYVINLSSNNLSGSIPTSIAELLNLRWLHLNNNSLDGELPPAVSVLERGLNGWENLQLLDLSENKISGNIPPWIGKNLSSLSVLILRRNMFSGNIPSELCQLVRLQILDLSLNNLSGGIPRCFSHFSGMILDNKLPPLGDGARISDPEQWQKEKASVATKGLFLEFTRILHLLDAMDLSSNKLNGSIPEQLGALSGLRSLNLSHNHLSGNVPSKIGGLKSIESLDFSDNRLFGAIPLSISTLNSLSHLNLSYNNLSGKIPTGNQLQTINDPSIYAGNLQLCGDPLPKKCPGDDDAAQPPLSTVHEDNDDDKYEKILFYFVILSGYATGFWAVIGTLIFKRDWRIAYFRFADDIKEWILATVAVNVARLKRMMEKTRDNE